MFDEYDETTAIAKAAVDDTMIPIDQYFLTLSADNIRVLSDYYMRLTRDGGEMIAEQSPLVMQSPTGRMSDISL